MRGHALLLWATLIAAAPAPVAPAPLAPGTISLDSGADDYPPPVRKAFVEAVSAALGEANFTPLPPPGKGRYLAHLRITRTARGTVAADAPATGVSGGIGGWGAGVAVGLPSRKTQLRALIVTELSLQIALRSDGRPVWTGRAVTAQVEGSREDAPGVVAAKLARAAIGSFPVQSTEPASVP